MNFNEESRIQKKKKKKDEVNRFQDQEKERLGERKKASRKTRNKGEIRNKREKEEGMREKRRREEERNQKRSNQSVHKNLNRIPLGNITGKN